MKQVPLTVFVLMVTGDGDTYQSVHRSREDAIEYLYREYVASNWSNEFEEEDIDDFAHEDAVEHYYNNVGEGYYELSKETVSFTVGELQDEIAKAVGLATHG